MARGIDGAGQGRSVADDFDHGPVLALRRRSSDPSMSPSPRREPRSRIAGCSEGVCNAYLLDVGPGGSQARHRAAMDRQLMAATGQHIGLQTDDRGSVFTSLGYRYQPVFMSAIVGEWLVTRPTARADSSSRRLVAAIGCRRPRPHGHRGRRKLDVQCRSTAGRAEHLIVPPRASTRSEADDAEPRAG